MTTGTVRTTAGRVGLQREEDGVLRVDVGGRSPLPGFVLPPIMTEEDLIDLAGLLLREALGQEVFGLLASALQVGVEGAADVCDAGTEEKIWQVTQRWDPAPPGGAPPLTDEPGKVTKLTGANSVHHPGPTS